MAARRFELARKGWGKRNGPLGGIALEVIGLLANVVDFRSGRLEPSIEWLMKKLRRSRDAVVRALKALRQHHFLDWVRRVEPTGNEVGPQVRQCSNAYRLSQPAGAAQALGLYGEAQPPDDAECALTARSEVVAAYDADAFPDSPLSQALDRLRGLMKCESAKRIEPGLLLVKGGK